MLNRRKVPGLSSGLGYPRNGEFRVLPSCREAETVWRVIAGLGNVYDGIVGLMGQGQTLVDWLAVKILIFGLLLVISAWVRWRMRAARYALLDSIESGAPPDLTGPAGASLKAMGPVLLLTTVLVAVAAWMGVNKPF